MASPFKQKGEEAIPLFREKGEVVTLTPSERKEGCPFLTPLKNGEWSFPHLQKNDCWPSPPPLEGNERLPPLFL